VLFKLIPSEKGGYNKTFAATIFFRQKWRVFMKTTLKRVLAFAMTFALLITLVPVNSVSAASKPKLNRTTASITVGKTTTLSVKSKPRNATVKWSTGAKKIATVSNKGKVTGVGIGTAKITAKVKAAKKTYKLTCAVTVNGISKTVSTQKALNTALKNKGVSKITLKTNKSAKYKISKGTYKNIALVVDAPKADVDNSGVFKSITVKAIKSDTFTERAKGNKIKVTADSARVIVSSGAQLSNLTFSSPNANVRLVANGTVDNVAVDASSTVLTIDAKATLGTVAVSDTAEGSRVVIETNSTVKSVAVDARSSEVKINADETAKISRVNINEAAEGS
jgi:hypothetical protein